MPITLNGTTGEVPATWTTAGRPASPVAGQTGYNSTLAILETYNGTAWVNTGNKNAITQTILTTGSGTYTVPSGVTWLRVSMVGGGGGGAGSGTGLTAGAGGTGGNTTFGTTFLAANGAAGAVGGSASIGAGATGIALSGAAGQANANATNFPGGTGGGSPFGGAGVSAAAGAGFAAQSNTGSGGGGGGASSTTVNTGAGGAAGGYVDAIISAPGASYSYAVGAGGTAGTAGTSGFAGAAGAAGLIVIEEHYNW